MKNVFALYGKNGIITLDPSNGGNGIKLNNPNPTLIYTVTLIKLIIIPPIVDSKNEVSANL